MRLTSFLCLILILLAGWMQLYSSAREIFNGVEDYKAEIERLNSRNEQQRLAVSLQREEFLEFRQNVATLMPNVLKQNGLGEDGYPLRSLASTLQKGENDLVRQTIAKTLFERGKGAFQEKDFAKAAKIFRQVIDRFGYSTYVPESYFLLAESEFQQNDLEQCTLVIQQMVELFPSHELTGFAMIRLGRVYEMQNRTEEAVDIYKTVLRSYPQRDVTSQAKASLKGVDL